MSNTLYWSSCAGKAAYGSRGAALRVLRRLVRRLTYRGRRYGRLHSYHCRCCHGWHLGSSQ